MSIDIRNREAHPLLAQIKKATGKGASKIVLELLRAERTRLATRLDPDEIENEAERILADTREIQRLWRKSPVLDLRSPDEILGYDENGLPI